MSKKSYIKLNVTLIHNLKKNVEELRREEAFSRNVLLAIPIGLDIVDGSGTIRFLNKIFLNAFGKQAIGKKC